MNSSDLVAGHANSPAASVTSTTTPRLQALAPPESPSATFMREDLARSGLTPEDIYAFPVLVSAFVPDAAAYRIPYFDLEGNQHLRMYRTRLAQGERRYDQPSEQEIGADCRYPYIPPETHKLQGDTLVVCEGEKKGACVAKYTAYPTISIGGAGNWRDAKGKVQVNENILAFIKKRGIKNVILVPDADVRRYDIAVEYGTLAAQLKREELAVKLVNPSGKIDDLMVEWGPEYAKGAFDALQAIESLVESAKELAENYGLAHTKTQSGTVKLEQNLANVLLLLRQHPAFPHIWYNDDTSQIVFDQTPIGMDEHGIDIVKFLQHNLQLTKISIHDVRRAVKRQAYENRRSPFREWLDLLKWDGTPRLERMFPSYCRSPDTEYVREVGRKWLPGAVWRTYEPGCPLDYMLITQGPQGRGKSTLPTLLWGLNQVVTILGKETQQKDDLSKYHMAKCVSFEEFDTMYVNNVGHLKGVITNRVDTFRKPYDLDNESHPRSCVFYASTNRHQFLKHDDTGYRRFVVVPFEQLHFAAIQRDREQLWAEAVSIYRSHKESETLFELSEVREASANAKGYVHEEDFIAKFEEWKLGALAGERPEAKRLMHDGYLFLTATAAYAFAGLEQGKRREDQRALKEHMLATGWEFKDKWKELPDKLDGGKRKRLEKVFILKIQAT